MSWTTIIQRRRKYLPSPFGRRVGGEGIITRTRREYNAFLHKALTLALSQRERGPTRRRALNRFAVGTNALTAVPCDPTEEQIQPERSEKRQERER